ncbi:MAG: O-antigen ligase family protein [Alcanivoracaceae bacterium]|nr:O-antigen ligase family protein [Alcanivoracaceae bacterium]
MAEQFIRNTLFSELLSRRNGGVFLVWLCLFFVAMGLVRGGKLIVLFDVLFALPAIYLLLARKLKSLRADRWLGGLLVSYLVFVAASGFWSESAQVDFLRLNVRMCGYYLIYAVIVVYAASHYAETRFGVEGATTPSKHTVGLLYFLIVAGVASAVASMIAWYGFDHIGPRLNFLGSARHPIMGVHYYALPLFCAVTLLFCGKQFRFFASFIVLFFLMLIVLTGSRGPLGAALVVIAVRLAVRYRWLFAVGVVCVGAFAVVLLLAPDWRELIGVRGMSWRPYIWQCALNRIPEALWLGHGSDGHNYVCSKMFDEKLVPWHAHNIWLSHLYWGGIAGASLLLSVVGRTVYLLWSNRRYAIAQVALMQVAFGYIALMVDGNTLVTKPGPMWITFLLPASVALAVSYWDKRERALAVSR